MIDEVKQIIIVRKDIGMDFGKFGAQISHASMAPIIHLMKNTDKDHLYNLDLSDEALFDIEEWLFSASFTKIILAVNSESKLFKYNKKLTEAGIYNVMIRDAGRTVFNEPTYTCLGTVPTRSSVINNVTGKLPLY